MLKKISRLGTIRAKLLKVLNSYELTDSIYSTGERCVYSWAVLLDRKNIAKHGTKASYQLTAITTETIKEGSKEWVNIFNLSVCKILNAKYGENLALQVLHQDIAQNLLLAQLQKDYHTLDVSLQCFCNAVQKILRGCKR